MTSEINEHHLTDDELLSLLKRESVGMLATVNEDKSPYIIPMHFVLLDDKIYMRTSTKGHKISNIMRDSRCSFAVLSILESDHDMKACFNSSVIKGNARIMDDGEEKTEILNRISRKYGKNEYISKEKAIFTGVIEITPEKITGKQRCML